MSARKSVSDAGNYFILDCNKLREAALEYKGSYDPSIAPSVSRYRNYRDNGGIHRIKLKTAEEFSKLFHKNIEYFRGNFPESDNAGVGASPNATSRPISIGVRADIEHEFESSPPARQAMVHRDVLPDGRLSCPSAAIDIADALMQMIEAGEFQAALRWLKGGHDHLAAILRKRPETSGAAAGQRALLSIASVLTPFGYRLSASFPIPAQSLAGGAPVWGVQAKMEAVAEILVAALHDRAASFREKRREQDDPCGKLKLTMPPEAGDEDVDDLKGRLLSMLNCAFTTGDAAGLREALWEFLDYQFAGRPPRRQASRSLDGPGNDPAAQAARAGRIKAWRETEDRGQQKYLVFPKQVTQEGSDALEKMLQDISAQVGGLPCIGLYGDEHVEVREIEFFGRLIAMLPVASR